MIYYQTPSTPPAAPPAPQPDAIEARLARAMRELEAQGRIVDKPALLATGLFTGAEIDANAEKAADLARLQSRADKAAYEAETAAMTAKAAS